MNEEEIYEELVELKESFDRIFEYLPANEAADIDQHDKDITQQEISRANMVQSQNQLQQQPQNQRQSQPKEKFHSQKNSQTNNQSSRSRQGDAKIRPGFEGPKIIRAKRQTK